MEDIIRPAKASGKDFLFDGDGYQAAQYMAKAIWVAVNKVLVKAGEAMRWLQTAASLAAKEADYRFVGPPLLDSCDAGLR